MGVYIKGMDKETAIRLCCKLPDLCDDDFVEVPEPHGRLIDIDNALDVIADEYGYEGIEDDIEWKVPTVIEAEGE